jgi:hypothetical protein
MLAGHPWLPVRPERPGDYAGGEGFRRDRNTTSDWFSVAPDDYGFQTLVAVDDAAVPEPITPLLLAAGLAGLAARARRMR